ncbi:uncharacterized protein PHACADRAFT_265740 [Phanerochaete carnosa HHB-10118-sp]|uniref:Uncharacterized protein n=1 Tax=Phanerochaete carnosa (strain HHB-10118-sp) TaxID=650164 RepID=K5VDL8_PHACS|nr:uncharacterized protein PHACADRAFT_265740 [Phanerochaete carnosa HHB-10118-sp]EKM49223.1 hypothetical protein PHACADRAFT_265740 [Phanerochaete carnosa HHB-10118-sp]
MALPPSVEVPIVSSAMRANVLDEDPSPLAVQFDDTCVVIPDPVVQSRMPRLIKKSYSLPLWRKRSNSNLPPTDTVEVAGSPEDRPGVSITVPLPSFSKSRSPSQGEQIHQPLVSCLVNGHTPSPRKLARRPSLPLPPRLDAATVPLRPCCLECYPITEECLRKDVTWEEKFTRGARRRRNSSADAHVHAHAHVQRHRKVCDDVPGFESVVFADEVDKRRSGTFETLEVSSDGEVEQLVPSFSRRLEFGAEPLASRNAVVIAEEAEEALFPLPSPSASFSHLPLSAPGDSSALLSQSPDAVPSLSPAGAPALDDAHRASVYYTPDSSPLASPREPAYTRSSRESSLSRGSDPPLTPSPPVPAKDASAKRGMSIPLASFEFVASPELDLPAYPVMRQSASAASLPGTPELGAVPRRKHFMHMPNLPGPGSFLRAGADLFKSVGGLGGAVPLSV